MKTLLRPDGWDLVTLSDIAAEDYGLVDGPFGSSLPASEYVEFGIPVIRGSNLTTGDGFFNSDEFVFVSEETAQRLSRSLCFPEDVIFTKKGTLGQTGFVPDDLRFEKYLLSSNQMKLTVNRRVAEPLFVYYYVSSPQSRKKFIQDSEATGVPKTNLEYLRTFPILLPPLAEQRAIAHILGTLDDKIELNRRMNATLEAIARAIFKSWFVDFDPVHAKLRGEQPYGMDAETAALFPDAFEDSELGPIPAGWGPTTLGETVEVVKGRSYKSSEIEQSNVALVTLKSINRGGGYNPQGLKPYAGKYRHEQVVSTGEIVIAFTDITQQAEVIGKPALVRWHPDYDLLVASLDLGIVRPITENINIPYLYELLSSEDFQAHVLGYVNGSTVLHLNKHGIPTFRYPLPMPAILAKFEALTQPLFDRISANEAESRTLAELRDALLPKLISGQIRILKDERTYPFSVR